MKNRVLVFGASGVGAKAKAVLEKEGKQVLAFSDNNELKWGEEFEGIKIISPADIDINNYDLFAIGNFKAKKSIEEQLVSLGVDKKNIVAPILPNTIWKNEVIKIEESKKGQKIAVVLGDGPAKEFCDNYFKLLDKWDFENNFWAFQYLVEDILCIVNHPSSKSWWKTNSISQYMNLQLSFYAITEMSNINEEDYKFELIISDCKDLENLIKNKNTYKFWNNRLPRQLEVDFINKIESLKEVCNNNNIPIDEIAIVSGAVLQAYGLREEKFADDIDIVMTDRFRQVYGSGLVIVSENVEMHPQNEMKCNLPELDYYDDEIIGNEQLHFYLRGVKFCDLQILYEHRCVTTNYDEVRIMEWFGCKH